MSQQGQRLIKWNQTADKLLVNIEISLMSYRTLSLATIVTSFFPFSLQHLSFLTELFHPLISIFFPIYDTWTIKRFNLNKELIQTKFHSRIRSLFFSRWRFVSSAWRTDSLIVVSFNNLNLIVQFERRTRVSMIYLSHWSKIWKFPCSPFSLA
jgi:hypothetical protein